MNDIFDYVESLCKKAKNASRQGAALSGEKKNLLLMSAADELESSLCDILSANKLDLSNAEQNGVAKTMLDRLALDEKRVKAIADAMREVASLADPVGSGERVVRPNGLIIEKTRVPLGVVGIIYEARPNVTADAAALCLKTGNACVLRSGKEALNSSRAIVNAIRRALEKGGVDPDMVGLIDSADRESSKSLMEMRGLVDVLIPRGGKGLIQSVVKNARVPVIETGAGNCHLYVDESADIDMALKVAINAKMSRPSVCNAIETILVHEGVAKEFLTQFAAMTKDGDHPLEIRGDERCQEILGCSAASEEDYDTEYNDYIAAVRVVDNINEAIDHIRRYSTGHSEAIITKSLDAASLFKRDVDAAAVYVNASTRFTDGGCFGFGAEIGISTQKLHARGPMGLFELTTVKYLVEGDGQIR
jgi:glutamate-5-semialdehyde dehydrogenase